jgi:NAD+ kinase
MSVFVESAVMEEPQLRNNQSFSPFKEKLCTFKEGKDDLTDKVDFIVCLGGDGTLLYASSLFQVNSYQTKNYFRIFFLQFRFCLILRKK